MTNALQTFNFEQREVRIIMQDGEPWFVGKDVCDYFKDTNHNRSLSRLDDDEKGVREMETLGGRQKLIIINESGLYHLLFNFEPTEARNVSEAYIAERRAIIKKFRKWVTSEVLPTLRKTGRYEIKKSPRIGRGLVSAAKEILKSAGIKGNQFTLALDKLYKHYTGESALAAMGVELRAPEQKQLLTPSEIGKQLGINGRRVNELLAGVGYQHKICGMWEAIGDGEKYSVMLDTNKRHSDGTPVRQLKWQTDIIDVLHEYLACNAAD